MGDKTRKSQKLGSTSRLLQNLTRALAAAMTVLLACGGTAHLYGQQTAPFTYSVDAKTPVVDLLPTPPKLLPELMPILGDNLADVPELLFQEPPDKSLTGAKGMQFLGQLMSNIVYLNKKQKDGFLKTLLTHRPDLQGLPFLLGDDCRDGYGSCPPFKTTLDTARAAMNKVKPAGTNPVQPADKDTAEKFWMEFQVAMANFGADLKKNKGSNAFVIKLAPPSSVAALMQIFAPDSADARLGLVNYLAGVAHVDSTRALAKLAIFSVEPEVRAAALEALKLRREKDYTDVMLQGLHYPWPAIAQNTARALVVLERHDFVVKLVELLDQPDPRLPKPRPDWGKDVFAAAQLVRLNHHKNCLLCHVPARESQNGKALVTAPVPLPGVPLQSALHYYSHQMPELSICVDVSYLRQDFSLLQKVDNAAPWPEMQRFDFLVRTVKISRGQAETFATQFQKKTAGQLSPYHTAFVTTLRDLTGLDCGTTAPEWRKALKLPG